MCYNLPNMTEKLGGNTNFDETDQTHLAISDLTKEISGISMGIRRIYDIRDVRHLTEEEYTRVRQLNKLKDEKIMDLLTLRNQNGFSSEISVEMDKFPDEILHPFSMNKVFIYVPSQIRGRGEKYYVETELSDIRRKGQVENSMEAEEFLGEKTETPEPPREFVERTVRELMKIKKLKRDVLEEKEPNTEPIAGYLNDLSARIISQRLIPLRAKGGIPPKYSLRVFLQAESQNGQAVERIVVYQNGNSPTDFSFTITGGKLAEALEENQSQYDGII